MKKKTVNLSKGDVWDEKCLYCGEETQSDYNQIEYKDSMDACIYTCPKCNKVFVSYEKDDYDKQVIEEVNR
jgi:NAD-dependent SIR2 family protein deacetylase